MPKPLVLYTVQVLGKATRGILSTSKLTPTEAAATLGLTVSEVLSIHTASAEEASVMISGAHIALGD